MWVLTVLQAARLLFNDQINCNIRTESSIINKDIARITRGHFDDAPLLSKLLIIGSLQDHIPYRSKFCFWVSAHGSEHFKFSTFESTQLFVLLMAYRNTIEILCLILEYLIYTYNGLLLWTMEITYLRKRTLGHTRL